MILLGSSPRGRGKRRHAMPTRIAHRLIPAWAGKTACRLGCEHAETAHPRVGGENPEIVTELVGADGSSPRGRGKLGCGFELGEIRGLIPAWAGKTEIRQAPGKIDQAHPRVGGENVSRARYTALSFGSSPRGRGKH